MGEGERVGGGDGGRGNNNALKIYVPTLKLFAKISRRALLD